MNRQTSDTTRRDFLKNAAVAGGTLSAAAAFQRAAYAQGSDTIKVGLIGAGGRGTGAAVQAASADPGTKITAVGDTFRDRIDGALNTIRRSMGDKADQKVAVDNDHIFTGFDAYKQVIDSGVDAVVLTSPPGFRPAHLAYAVEKGKHVFCEKPVAVDGPGVRSVMESSEKAKEKGLSLVSGLCWRYHLPKRATFEKIKEGLIGDVLATHSTYLTGPLWHRGRDANWSEMEYQIRNWLYFTWLSGDHICEQAIHSIDKNQWALNDITPIHCTAIGGRQVRTDPQWGNIYDHFGVEYVFENDVRSYHFCRQTGGCYNSTDDEVIGTKGVAHTSNHYIVDHKGKKLWQYDGPQNDMYQTEHDEMFASIRAGKPINNGHYMTVSTMMAVIGRMSAYTGKQIKWTDAWNSKEKLGPQTLEWGKVETPPVAMPGQTPFA